MPDLPAGLLGGVAVDEGCHGVTLDGFGGAVGAGAVRFKPAGGDAALGESADVLAECVACGDVGEDVGCLFLHSGGEGEVGEGAVAGGA